MLARDRDLLALEPTLFRDVAQRAQRVVRGEGDLTSGTLTLTSQDVDFEAARVEAGHIVLVHIGAAGAEPVALEVLGRDSAMEVSVSRLRESREAEPIVPADASDAVCEVWTFRPQIALVHAELMRALGMEPLGADGSEGDALGDGYTAADITNMGAVRAVEAVGALAVIFRSAAGAGDAGAELRERASAYRARYSALRAGTPVHLGLDADGRPGAVRRFGTIELIR